MTEKPTSTPASAPPPVDRLSDIVRQAEAQENNPKFNEQFREQLRQLRLTREEMADLSSKFEQSSIERIKNDARSVILEQMTEERQSFIESLDLRAKGETFVQGMGNTAETISTTVLPKTWTERMSRGQKIATGTAITLGAGVVLWQLGKAIFGWGKKAASEGREAAQAAGGGFFRKMLIGTGIGLGAFFGGRALYKAFGKEIDKRMPTLPKGADTALKTAKTVTGVTSGASSKLIERGEKQVEALTEIPAAAYEYLQNGDFDKLVEHGWSFTRKESVWLFETATQTITVPASFIQKMMSDTLPSGWEGGWLYGEAGASYVLGKATITAILTGKLRMPLSMRSVGMTATRMAGWPALAVWDGAKTIGLVLSEDGRVIAKNAVTRWGPMGMVRDVLARSRASSGTVEGLESGLKYFQYQRSLLGSMEREAEGIGKGMVREGSIRSLSNASERLAAMLSKTANGLRETLKKEGKQIPQWIDQLANAHGLADAKGIVTAVDEAGKTIKATADALNEAAKEFKTFDELKDAITTARTAKDNKRLAQLLRSPLLREAAKNGDETAKGLLRVQRLLTMGKWAVRGVAVLGTLIDAVMIGANEFAIRDAKKAGNLGMQQTLESKRTSLITSGIGGMGLLAIAGPGALPGVIAASFYTNAVYDNLIDWDKSSTDWMRETPESLKQKMKEIPYGNVTMGHRGTMKGDSVISYYAKRLPFVGRSAEDLQKEQSTDMEWIERVNRNMRQEILAAYLLKTLPPIHALPGENENQQKERVTAMVRDRMNFFSKITNGTYVIGDLGDVFYDTAGSYADLRALSRNAKDARTLTYEFDGKTKNLDLSALDYVGGADEKPDGQQAFYATLSQYEQEVKPQLEALQDLANITDDSTPQS